MTAGSDGAGGSDRTGDRSGSNGTGRQGTDAVYQELRPLMFSIAYRMLGSVTEAEDAVQETFLRYHQAVASSGEPDSPKAYLSAVVTRLCIDQLRSARVRREAYVGEWLPEPLLTGPVPLAELAGPDPAAAAEQADSLSMAFLLLLERLSPLERAVFLLHDVFSYDYEETAEIVGRSGAACRQLAHRARQHLEAERPRFDVAGPDRDELADRFFAAVGDGDMDGLLNLLASDVEVHGDSAGAPLSWGRPITGREHVARLLGTLGRQLLHSGASLQTTEVNGQPGALVRGPDGRLVAVLTIDISGGLIRTVRSVISPGKLRHLGPLADVAKLIEERRRT
jgi:RNA polymerase sigma-70 factor, ECF subfamily